MTTATETRDEIRTAAPPLEGYVLETDRGVTTIADEVVAKLAGIATREVDGVNDFGGSFRRLLSRVRPGEQLTQGVNVEVGRKEAAIDLVIVAEYGYPIPDLAQRIRENVIARVETDTGLVVKEVNIEIDDLHVPAPGKPAESRVE